MYTGISFFFIVLGLTQVVAGIALGKLQFTVFGVFFVLGGIAGLARARKFQSSIEAAQTDPKSATTVEAFLLKSPLLAIGSIRGTLAVDDQALTFTKADGTVLMSVPLSQAQVVKGTGVMKVTTPQKTYRFVFGIAFAATQGEYIGEKFAAEIAKRLPSTQPGQPQQVTIKTSPRGKALVALFVFGFIGFALLVIIVISLFG